MLGKIEGRSRRGRRKGRWLEGITNAMGLRLDELRGIVKGRSWHAAAVGSHRVDVTQRLNSGRPGQE